MFEFEQEYATNPPSKEQVFKCAIIMFSYEINSKLKFCSQAEEEI